MQTENLEMYFDRLVPKMNLMIRKINDFSDKSDEFIFNIEKFKDQKASREMVKFRHMLDNYFKAYKYYLLGTNLTFYFKKINNTIFAGLYNISTKEYLTSTVFLEYDGSSLDIYKGYINYFSQIFMNYLTVK